MRALTPQWRGWAWLAALCGAAIALVTLRHGFVPGNDSVSYWSATRDVRDGHPFSAGMFPAFSDLDLRAMVHDGRAPFVDFPVGFPLLSGGLAVVLGLSAARLLLVVAAVATTTGLIVHGPRRAQSYPALATRAAISWMVISLPIALEVRQNALPEPLFVAGLLLFSLQVLRLRDDRPLVALWTAATIGAALGVVRFVGLPLVVVLVIAAWRARVPRRHLAGAALVCALPGVWNAMWASGMTDRHPHLLARSRVDLKFAAHSIGGWFSSWRTSIADILSPHWSVPLPYYLVAVLTLATITVGAVRWLRHGPDAPDGTLLLTVAGALLASVVLTMFAYDALTKFEPRMLYPPGVLLAVAWAWSPPTRLQPRTTAVIAAAWALAAAGPWNWTAPTFHPDAARVAVIREANPAVIVTNLADTIHYETGIPAAYFPSDVRVHSGQPRDRDAVVSGLPCTLLHDHGLIVIDTAGYLPLDPWLAQWLDDQEAAGLLTRAQHPGLELYAPTPGACPAE